MMSTDVFVSGLLAFEEENMAPPPCGYYNRINGKEQGRAVRFSVFGYPGFAGAGLSSPAGHQKEKDILLDVLFFLVGEAGLEPARPQ